MVIFVSFKFNWERDHVLDEFVAAVEHNLWGELVEFNFVLGTVVIKTKKFEFTEWDLSLKEFLMDLIGGVLNNHQKFRFGVVWRVVLVVDFSRQDSGVKSIEFDVMLFFQFSCKDFGVELFNLLEERVGLLEEIVTYEWYRCSGDGVMMLEDSQVLEHLSLAGDNLLGVVFVVRDGVLRLKSQRGVKLGTGQFDHSLNMGFSGEETTPVFVRVL